MGVLVTYTGVREVCYELFILLFCLWKHFRIKDFEFVLGVRNVSYISHLPLSLVSDVDWLVHFQVFFAHAPSTRFDVRCFHLHTKSAKPIADVS